jgi:hypothetical protein
MAINSEKRLTFAEIRDLPWLPPRRGGGKLSVTTPWRWWHHGLNGVHLEVESIGGQPAVTEQALRDFFARVGEAKRNGGRPVAETPARRRRAVAEASDALAAEGIGA